MSDTRGGGSGAGMEEPKTIQTSVWKSEFGREYTDRNTFDNEELNQLYLKNYGVTRRQINESSLGDIGHDASFLEVGCNTGNQLSLLQEMGYRDLSGIELQPYALEIARRRLPGISLQSGSALALPHASESFDIVFTSGVLIHIAPDDLPMALDEIHRCSRKFIWGMEYYASQVSEVRYRGQRGLLWKADYARLYLDRFPDLELVREQRLPYLENENLDTVFLLRKKQSV